VIEPANIPEDYTNGPAMSVLRSDKQRRFCFLMGSGLTTAAEAAREAGYSDNGEAAKRTAYKMMQEDNVLAAIREVAVKALGGLVPLAIRTAEDILNDRTIPAERARMLSTILDRTGHSPKFEQKITVEHRHDYRELEEFARRLAIESGLREDHFLPQPKVIEGDPVLSETEE
jgi:phage terminase small subunit